MRATKLPSSKCEKCGKSDWRPIKQMGAVLGYRCKECGKGVIWSPGFAKGWIEKGGK